MLVDHIKRHRGSKSLFWNQENWQPLCRQCHDYKTAVELLKHKVPIDSTRIVEIGSGHGVAVDERPDWHVYHHESQREMLGCGDGDDDLLIDRTAWCQRFVFDLSIRFVYIYVPINSEGTWLARQIGAIVKEGGNRTL